MLRKLSVLRSCVQKGIEMEFERKWLVKGWPDSLLNLLYEQKMEQSYVNLRPTVRIRKEQVIGMEPEYVFCLKSHSTHDGIAREEIEFNISRDVFERIGEFIGKPAIIKNRRTYALKNGLKLEVNCVDSGTEFESWYAEIEYSTEEEARDWKPERVGLENYLNDECTGKPGSSMGDYWTETRL